jgi:hypothetical protein
MKEKTVFGCRLPLFFDLSPRRAASTRGRSLSTGKEGTFELLAALGDLFGCPVIWAACEKQNRQGF